MWRCIRVLQMQQLGRDAHKQAAFPAPKPEEGTAPAGRTAPGPQLPQRPTELLANTESDAAEALLSFLWPSRVRNLIVQDQGADKPTGAPPSMLLQLKTKTCIRKCTEVVSVCLQGRHDVGLLDTSPVHCVTAHSLRSQG